MARKNLLAGLVAPESAPGTQSASPAYPMRGASKNMIRSLDELAKQADKFLEGEAVVEIDPKLIEGSFVSDRLEDASEQFEELKQAIQERGQDTPVLLRPHPSTAGLYQVVFGHRRVRAARELGRAVRAVVKQLDDKSHVIAQGQENSARANLTFIERALFARRLLDLGYDRNVISSALAANQATVSKMMSVTDRIPADIVERIGPAPSVGRERWVELSLLVGKASNEDRVRSLALDGDFAKLESDERFNALFSALNRSGKTVRKTEMPAAKLLWQPSDKGVSAQISNTGKAFTLSMKAKNAARFGKYLSDNLDRLYAEFMDETTNQGD